MSALDLDIAGPIRTALSENAAIAALLSAWQSEPAVFTRRPTPEGAGYPMAIVNPAAAIGDRDYLATQKPLVMRDIVFYGVRGVPGTAEDQLRRVEQLGYLARDLFHRNRFSLSLTGFSVVEIAASGPTEAPTTDDKLVGRRVSLTVHLQRLA